MDLCAECAAAYLGEQQLCVERQLALETAPIDVHGRSTLLMGEWQRTFRHYRRAEHSLRCYSSHFTSIVRVQFHDEQTAGIYVRVRYMQTRGGASSASSASSAALLDPVNFERLSYLFFADRVSRKSMTCSVCGPCFLAVAFCRACPSVCAVGFCFRCYSERRFGGALHGVSHVDDYQVSDGSAA